MASAQPTLLLNHIRRLVAAPSHGQCSDRELLRRFATQHDEIAFTTLLRRHGPMVLRVCQRVLHNWHDAEDVFQATFLLLARKAVSSRWHDSVANWLHEVAYRLSLKAKTTAARRSVYERRASIVARSGDRATTADPLADLTGRELQTVLDAELAQLPEKYRAPLVLCYLEGATRDEAAQRLGCPLSTLGLRLEQGRERLRSRLARRGLVLSTALSAALLTEGAMQAALPATLLASTARGASWVAAGKVAGSVVSARVAALLAEGLNTLFVPKLKAAAALLLVVSLAGALTYGVMAQGQSEKPAAARRGEVTSPPRAAGQKPPAEGKEPKKAASEPLLQPNPEVGAKMTVSGRVLDAAGKAVPGADVAVCGRQGVLLSGGEWWVTLRNDIAGQGKTDAEGRFRLVVPSTDPLMNVRTARVIAMKEAAGLAWKALDPNVAEADVELRLMPVQPVRGRLISIQGEGAAKVKVHVVRITRRQPEKGEREEDAAIRPPVALGLTATTDAHGEFAFSSFGPNVKLELEIRDPGYQRKDEWFVETADKKQCENLQLVLPPGQVVEGRIVYADTRKPVPHARLMIVSPYIVDDETDAEGRFRISIFSGQFSKGDVGVHAYPPEGEPYMPASQGVHFDKGVVRREVQIALPRGVLLRGKVTEAGSGRPVAGAIVTYNADSNVRARSRRDGTYQIGAWPGQAARVVVTHPTGEYIPQIIGSAGGSLDKPIGDPSYYHGIVEVSVKPDDKVKEVNVALRRGITIAGRLVGADNKPVASALMFVSAHKSPTEKTMHPILVRGGLFEVRGCDPEKKYQLLFLEYPRLPRMLMMAEGLQTFGQFWLAELVNGKDWRGASVEVLAKKGVDEPLVVRVAPCGSAKLRFTDAAGKPRAGFIAWLQLVVTPGPPLWKAVETKTLAAEVVSLAGPYGDQPPGQPKTDAQGYVTYHGLIPGATYRIKMHGAGLRNDVLKDFTVEAGKTVDLGDVVVEEPR